MTRHQELRMELWRDAFVASVRGNAKASKSAHVYCADAAVEEFDKRFEEPKPSAPPVRPATTERR